MRFIGWRLVGYQPVWQYAIVQGEIVRAIVNYPIYLPVFE